MFGPALESPMLRDVIVHMRNEQPLLADLLFESAPTDMLLICHNLRTMNGEKPAFINWTDSVFAIPLGHVRFVEIPAASIETLRAERAARAEAGKPEGESGATLLDRLAWLDIGTKREAGAAEELDGDLLRRVRDA
jgi:hypothetical protein